MSTGAPKGRPKESDRVVVDTFLSIQQRVGICIDCGARYTGSKEQVPCYKCKRPIATKDVNCVKKVPTGIWSFFKEVADKKADDEPVA